MSKTVWKNKSENELLQEGNKRSSELHEIDLEIAKIKVDLKKLKIKRIRAKERFNTILHWMKVRVNY